MDFSSQWERFSNSKEKGDIIVYLTQICSNIFASFSIIFLVSKFANLLVCKREKIYILSKNGHFPVHLSYLLNKKDHMYWECKFRKFSQSIIWLVSKANET